MNNYLISGSPHIHGWESTKKILYSVVIATGKEISIKTRPTNAGLNGLLPKPPNDILPIPMATIAPTIIIHAGMLDGKLNANKIPVIIADPSAIVH